MQTGIKASTNKPGRLGAFFAASCVTVAAFVAAIAPGGPAEAWQAARSNFAELVTSGEGGSHILGNISAPTKLVEYVSYTCSHCANFSVESAAAMRTRFVTPGNLSLEVRHIIRDPVDMAMAAAANCGAPARFFSRHEALMAEQAAILTRVRALPQATVQSWGQAAPGQRLRRVADDSGVTAWMRRRGFTPLQINQCLSDLSLQQRLVALSQAGTAAGVTHTPSFAINGRLLPAQEAHDWTTLSAVLAATSGPAR